MYSMCVSHGNMYWRCVLLPPDPCCPPGGNIKHHNKRFVYYVNIARRLSKSKNVRTTVRGLLTVLKKICISHRGLLTPKFLCASHRQGSKRSFTFSTNAKPQDSRRRTLCNV